MNDETLEKKLNKYRPLEDVAKAQEYLSMLCKGDRPTMSVPPQVDDWDMVLSRVISKCEEIDKTSTKNGWSMCNCYPMDAPLMPPNLSNCIVAVDNGRGGIEYDIAKFHGRDGTFRVKTKYGDISLFPRYIIRDVSKRSIYAFKPFKGFNS